MQDCIPLTVAQVVKDIKTTLRSKLAGLEKQEMIHKLRLRKDMTIEVTYTYGSNPSKVLHSSLLLIDVWL
ncbi:unnamed protein product [Arabis nemorensis]|uniref:Uncharacterized protein n=1 Tax=Arabis nemorensis TaxID=586526 RepID=A0A565B560_9BRAS|nr:unnamed protein product [Arabis nemorensis]